MKKQVDTVVLIPHFESPEELQKSLLSIREKIPIDVLIVDDGSSTNKIDEAALKSTIPPNLSVKVLCQKENQGIEHALNRGLSSILTQGYSYIARLDCGDLCAENRFLIQKEFLAAHTEVGLVGSFVHFVGLNGERLFNFKPPTAHGQLVKKMYLNCMFIHPSIMMKTEVVRKIGLYPTIYPAAEDYAYFFEIIKHFGTANIPQYLLYCEVNPHGISLTRRNQQLKSRIRIILKHFHFGLYPIYGLLRNLLIFVVPVRLIDFLKKSFHRPGAY